MIARAAIVLAASLPCACAGGPPSRTFDGALATMRFVRIEAMTFAMGSVETEAGREPQELRHPVRLTRPFFLAVTEVTQEQWQEVMGANPSHFASCGAACPVERVNYHEITAFLERLNQRGRGVYRLPTEAEWELACRAGGAAPFGHSGHLDASMANIDGRFPYNAPATAAGRGTVPVASYAANGWGLFDMSGNVWEWTADDHCPYTDLPSTDPIGVCGSGLKVIRGGSWAFDGNSARCALRYTHRPQDRGFSLGFRLARDAN